MNSYEHSSDMRNVSNHSSHDRYCLYSLRLTFERFSFVLVTLSKKGIDSFPIEH